MHPSVAMAQNSISAAAALVMLLMLLCVAGDTSTARPPIGMPNCVTSCGDVHVPYPFGIGMDTSCYLPGFNLTCDDTAGSGDKGPRLLLDAEGTLQVLWIDISRPSVRAQRNGDVKIEVDADGNGNGNGTFSPGLLRDGPYTIDSEDTSLILTGCNVQATVRSGNVIVASCTSLCDDDIEEDGALPTANGESNSLDQRCYGGNRGCCWAHIVTLDYDDDQEEAKTHRSAGGTTRYDVQLRWFGTNHSADLERVPVRVFVADADWSFSDDLLHTGRLPSKDTMAVPVFLNWDVVGHPMGSLCKSNHSEHENGTRKGSYACSCSHGYYGNPYLTDGCKDYNECEMPQEEWKCYGECVNTEGSFMCRCPSGTTGNHSIPDGCVASGDISDRCERRCGDVEVPYPFGMGPSNCYRPGFHLSCNTSHDISWFLLGGANLRVVNISIANSTVRVVRTNALITTDRDLETTSFLSDLQSGFSFLFDGEAEYYLSARNELVLTGCNAQAILFGDGDLDIISGCASFCSPDNATTINSGGKSCYSIGCCQARISESTEGMPSLLRFNWFDTNDPRDLVPLPGFVFTAEEGWFDQPDVAGKLMREGRRDEDLKLAAAMEVPILLRWEVLHLQNGSSANPSSRRDCSGEVARDLCKSKKSHCKPGNKGYTCQRNDGYQGNPYVADGCKGGRAKSFQGLSIIIGVASGAGLILVVLIAYFISYKIKLHRAQMLKRKYFEQNRGKLLQQLLSQRADIAEGMIITLEELEKATNNFDKSRELGGGGHGTVYKGILSDLHVVAIKKPKMVVQREIDEFINEVAILSQINHRNVVKLYGCCLETEVPLLVYAFISNGTLNDHLHVEGSRSLSWDDRLRIATETAKSLAYLHSIALVPIIHRDIKPANILLDDSLTAKVADFGASRYIPLEKSGLTTMVEVTLGYLDPVCLHTWRLTEKSDVYSFGVMLIEMMTRKKPYTYRTSEGNCLVAYFVTLFAEGNVLQIIDPQIISEGGKRIDEIARIAVACVKLRGEERPTMRQVELRLEAVQSPKEFEANNDIAVNSPLACKAGLTSRQYSMEEEYMVSARYPR